MPDDPLKIAVFSDSVLPILNGVSVSIDALVNELRNQGHSVHLFCPRFPGYKDPDPNTYRFRSMETPWTKGYPFAYPPYYRMLLKFRKHKFDVMHIHTPGLVGMVGLRWAQSHEVPLVATYHTLYDRYTHYIPLLPRRYVRFRIAKHTNFFYSQANHVITPSDASLKWLRRHSVSGPITVIPTGAPAQRHFDRSEVRQSLGIPAEQRIMLYVGRLSKEKNLETLLGMAALAFQQDPLLRLWIVGDGPHHSACTAEVRRLGIGDRVRFVGFVPRQEVDKFYAASDLFVFSSITETQGLVIQEAMTYGLPAIAVTGGGASASIEEGINGFTVKNDPELFAKRVLAVLEDERLHARLSDGAARSVRSHGAGNMCSRVVTVYRTVIGAQKRLESKSNVRVL